MNKHHKGFDSKKRWGNSGIEGVGANSPAMMAARAGFASMPSKLKVTSKKGEPDSYSRALNKKKGVKAGSQKDGGWVGKNAEGSHSRFHYGK